MLKLRVMGMNAVFSLKSQLQVRRRSSSGGGGGRRRRKEEKG